MSDPLEAHLNVRYWHKADIELTLNMSAFGGKADMIVL